MKRGIIELITGIIFLAGLTFKFAHYPGAALLLVLGLSLGSILLLAQFFKGSSKDPLSSLIYKKDGLADLNLNFIPQYPLRVHFKGLVNEFDNIKLLSEKWISSQDFLNLDNKIKFFKTHHVMCNLGKNSFTNYENTFGVIYVVRDPRNVITSIKNHYELNDEKAINWMKNEKNFLYDVEKFEEV